MNKIIFLLTSDVKRLHQNFFSVFILTNLYIKFKSFIKKSWKTDLILILSYKMTNLYKNSPLFLVIYSVIPLGIFFYNGINICEEQFFLYNK